MHGKAGVAGRDPYYFARASVADMIPIKETHTHPLLRFPGPTGASGISILSPGQREKHVSKVVLVVTVRYRLPAIRFLSKVAKYWRDQGPL